MLVGAPVRIKNAASVWHGVTGKIVKVESGTVHIDPNEVPESEAAFGHNRVLAELWEVDIIPPKGEKWQLRGPDRANCVQYRPAENPVDWKRASECIAAQEGVVGIVMDPETDNVNGLWLDDLATGRGRNDAGTAIFSGIDELEPGDRCLLVPYTGEWFDGFELGGFETEQIVRLFGIASTSEHELVRRDALDSIPAILDPLRATGYKLLLRREPLVEQQNGVYLPTKEHHRTHRATVWSAGPLSGYKDGDTIVYHGRAIYDLDCSGLGLPGDPSDYCFIDSRNTYCCQIDETTSQREPAEVA